MNREGFDLNVLVHKLDFCCRYEKSRLLMESPVGYVPVSELVPDVCAPPPQHRLGLSIVSGLVAQLTFSYYITAVCSKK